MLSVLGTFVPYTLVTQTETQCTHLNPLRKTSPETVATCSGTHTWERNICNTHLRVALLLLLCSLSLLYFVAPLSSCSLFISLTTGYLLFVISYLFFLSLSLSLSLSLPYSLCSCFPMDQNICTSLFLSLSLSLSVCLSLSPLFLSFFLSPSVLSAIHSFPFFNLGEFPTDRIFCTALHLLPELHPRPKHRHSKHQNINFSCICVLGACDVQREWGELRQDQKMFPMMNHRPTCRIITQTLTESATHVKNANTKLRYVPERERQKRERQREIERETEGETERERVGERDRKRDRESDKREGKKQTRKNSGHNWWTLLREGNCLQCFGPLVFFSCQTAMSLDHLQGET